MSSSTGAATDHAVEQQQAEHLLSAPDAPDRPHSTPPAIQSPTNAASSTAGGRRESAISPPVSHATRMLAKLASHHSATRRAASVDWTGEDRPVTPSLSYIHSRASTPMRQDSRVASPALPDPLNVNTPAAAAGTTSPATPSSAATINLSSRLSSPSVLAPLPHARSARLFGWNTPPMHSREPSASREMRGAVHERESSLSRERGSWANGATGRLPVSISAGEPVPAAAAAAPSSYRPRKADHSPAGDSYHPTKLHRRASSSTTASSSTSSQPSSASPPTLLSLAAIPMDGEQTPFAESPMNARKLQSAESAPNTAAPPSHRQKHAVGTPSLSDSVHSFTVHSPVVSVIGAAAASVRPSTVSSLAAQKPLSTQNRVTTSTASARAKIVKRKEMKRPLLPPATVGAAQPTSSAQALPASLGGESLSSTIPLDSTLLLSARGRPSAASSSLSPSRSSTTVAASPSAKSTGRLSSSSTSPSRHLPPAIHIAASMKGSVRPAVSPMSSSLLTSRVPPPQPELPAKFIKTATTVQEFEAGKKRSSSECAARGQRCSYTSAVALSRARLAAERAGLPSPADVETLAIISARAAKQKTVTKQQQRKLIEKLYKEARETEEKVEAMRKEREKKELSELKQFRREPRAASVVADAVSSESEAKTDVPPALSASTVDTSASAAVAAASTSTAVVPSSSAPAPSASDEKSSTSVTTKPKSKPASSSSTSGLSFTTSLYYRSLLEQEDRLLSLDQIRRNQYSYQPKLSEGTEELAERSRQRSRSRGQKNMSTYGGEKHRSVSRGKGRSQSATGRKMPDEEKTSDPVEGPISSSSHVSFTFRPTLSPNSTEIINTMRFRSTPNGSSSDRSHLQLKRTDPNHILHRVGMKANPTKRRKERLAKHAKELEKAHPFTPTLLNDAFRISPPPDRDSVSPIKHPEIAHVTMGEYFRYEEEFKHAMSDPDDDPQEEKLTAEDIEAGRSLWFFSKLRVGDKIDFYVREPLPAEDHADVPIVPRASSWRPAVVTSVDKLGGRLRVHYRAHSSAATVDEWVSNATCVAARGKGKELAKTGQLALLNADSDSLTLANDSPSPHFSPSSSAAVRRAREQEKAMNEHLMGSPTAKRSASAAGTAADAIKRAREREKSFSQTLTSPTARRSSSMMSENRPSTAPAQDAIPEEERLTLRARSVTPSGGARDGSASRESDRFDYGAAKGSPAHGLISITSPRAPRPASLTSLTKPASVSPFLRVAPIAPPTRILSGHSELLTGRLYQWKKDQRERRQREREEQERKELEECTFEPVINKTRRRSTSRNAAVRQAGDFSTPMTKIERAQAIAADMLHFKQQRTPSPTAVALATTVGSTDPHASPLSPRPSPHKAPHHLFSPSACVHGLQLQVQGGAEATGSPARGAMVDARVESPQRSGASDASPQVLLSPARSIVSSSIRLASPHAEVAAIGSHLHRQQSARAKRTESATRARGETSRDRIDFDQIQDVAVEKLLSPAQKKVRRAKWSAKKKLVRRPLALMPGMHAPKYISALTCSQNPCLIHPCPTHSPLPQEEEVPRLPNSYEALAALQAKAGKGGYADLHGGDEAVRMIALTPAVPIPTSSSTSTRRGRNRHRSIPNLPLPISLTSSPRVHGIQMLQPVTVQVSPELTGPSGASGSPTLEGSMQMQLLSPSTTLQELSLLNLRSAVGVSPTASASHHNHKRTSRGNHHRESSDPKAHQEEKQGEQPFRPPPKLASPPSKAKRSAYPTGSGSKKKKPSTPVLSADDRAIQLRASMASIVSGLPDLSAMFARRRGQEQVEQEEQLQLVEQQEVMRVHVEDSDAPAASTSVSSNSPVKKSSSSKASSQTDPSSSSADSGLPVSPPLRLRKTHSRGLSQLVFAAPFPLEDIHSAPAVAVMESERKSQQQGRRKNSAPPLHPSAKKPSSSESGAFSNEDSEEISVESSTPVDGDSYSDLSPSGSPAIAPRVRSATDVPCKLYRILADPTSRALFLAFIQREHSSENLAFFDEIQRLRADLKAAKVSDVSKTPWALQRFKQIRRKYLTSGSDQQVNLPDGIVRDCSNALDAISGDASSSVSSVSLTPSDSPLGPRRASQITTTSIPPPFSFLDQTPPTIFDPAQRVIYSLIEKDSFQRFLKTEEWAKWKEEHE